MKVFGYVAKLAIGMGLLYVLFHDSPYLTQAPLTLFQYPGRAAAIIFVIWLTQLLVATRYYLLLKAVIAGVRYRNVFLVTSIGQFLAQTFLGTIASDASRLSLLKKTQGLTLPALTGTMILDRMISSYGLILVCGIGAALALNDSSLADNAVIQYLSMPLAALIAGGLSVFTVFALFRVHGVQRFLKDLLVARIKHSAALTLLRAIKTVSQAPRLIAVGVLIAAAGQLMPVLAFAFVMGDRLAPLSAHQTIVLLPLALLANMVPITPAGIGVGEAAFDGLVTTFAHVPAGYGAVVFLQYRLMSILAALPGLIAMVVYSHEAAS